MFFPAYTEVRDETAEVAVGDEIGVVVQQRREAPRAQPLHRRALGLLAAPGERVRAYQPLAWLTTADDRQFGPQGG